MMTAELSHGLRPKSSKIYHKASRLIARNFLFLVKDSKFFWMSLLARFQIVRNWGVKRYTTQQISNSISIESSTVATDDPLTEVHHKLWEDGYYSGIRLKPQTTQALLQFSQEQYCYGNRDLNLALQIQDRQQFEADRNCSLKIASYLDTHELCKTVQDLKDDPILQEIATQYLGGCPKYHRGELLWSFPKACTQTEKVSLAQVLHCDINDYRTIKFFFYLVDVNQDNGPHRYVKGSHRNRSLLHQWMGQRIASIADSSLIKKYGSHQVTTICGPSGFGFVGDPYTLHQGVTPTKSPRLLLQLEFGINKYKTWYFNTP